MALALNARRGMGQADPARLRQVYEMLCIDPLAYVDLRASSGIVGRLGRDIASGAVIAQEIGWYAEDGQGVARLRGFEAWAAEQGADAVEVCTEPGKRLDRLGYTLHSLKWRTV
ncbi:hypothetical protein CFI11_13050 [Thalassococcus sp. S3]|nr:hypothetical protein CFI11_13050 [Thalassococcus sp. S3]